jgi:hypothetical protein
MFFGVVYFFVDAFLAASVDRGWFHDHASHFLLRNRLSERLDFVRDGIFAFGHSTDLTPVIGLPRAVDEVIDRCVGSRKTGDDGEILLTCFGKVFASNSFAVCDIDD